MKPSERIKEGIKAAQHVQKQVQAEVNRLSTLIHQECSDPNVTYAPDAAKHAAALSLKLQELHGLNVTLDNYATLCRVFRQEEAAHA